MDTRVSHPKKISCTYCHVSIKAMHSHPASFINAWISQCTVYHSGTKLHISFSVNFSYQYNAAGTTFPKKEVFCNQLMCSSLLVSLKKNPISSFQFKYQFQYQCLQFCLCYTYTMHVYRLLYISLHQCNNLIELTVVPSTRTESR